MRQMLLQTKNKKTKNPGSENNEIRKMSGDQINQKMMAVKVLYITQKIHSPQTKKIIFVRLNTFG